MNYQSFPSINQPYDHTSLYGYHNYKLCRGFKYFFHPYLGKIPMLTNIVQMGWNHQLVNMYMNISIWQGLQNDIRNVQELHPPPQSLHTHHFHRGCQVLMTPVADCTAQGARCHCRRGLATSSISFPEVLLKFNFFDNFWIPMVSHSKRHTSPHRNVIYESWVRWLWKWPEPSSQRNNFVDGSLVGEKSTFRGKLRYVWFT